MRRAPRSFLLLLLCVAGLGLAPSCSTGSAVPEASPDAGGMSSCSRGTSGCACTADGGCNRGLLCISNLCLPSEGTPGDPPQNDPLRPLPGIGGSTATAEPNSGGSGGAPDAASPADSGPGNSNETDASTAEPPDASPAPDSGA